jgi:hypothetical protein
MLATGHIPVTEDAETAAKKPVLLAVASDALRFQESDDGLSCG